MVTGFPFPRGCCLVLSALFPLFRCVCNAAMSLSPLPHPVTGPVRTPHPSSRVYTPPGRQQPYGAGPLDPHPSGDRFPHLARVAPIPHPCVCVVRFLFDSLKTLCGPCHTFVLARSPYPILLGMPIPHRVACIACVYPNQPHATLWSLPEGPFLASCTGCSYLYSRCLLARCCGSSGCVFMLFLDDLASVRTPWGTSPPPPFPLCVRARPTISCCFSVFFYPPPCMHARHHCTGHLVTAPLGSRL